MKTTAFHEAFSDWLIPWYHYIPVNYDYSDMFSVLLYFFGLDQSDQQAHDEELKVIADRSRDWAENQISWEMHKVSFRRLVNYQKAYTFRSICIDFVWNGRG